MLFSIPDLTPDDRFWRIDWYGEVAYQVNFYRRSQPVYKLLFSPVLLRSASQDVVTDVGQQREAWLPIGTLPMVSIGDLWQNGEKIVQPDYQQESFNVWIDQNSTDFIKAGLSLDGKFLLPLNEHPWHRGATQSYCVCVSIRNGRRLIIPCMELIRFYFGSSSNLLHKLFTAPLCEELLWRDKSLDPMTQHLHIKLASKLGAASASDIGRIALSKEAWRSAAGVYGSCVAATTQDCTAYPYTRVPFSGHTMLQASGKWLSFDGKPGSTFVVYRLHSCVHPFPFKSLSYEVDASTVYRGNMQQRTNTESSGRYATRPRQRGGSKSTVSDRDPDAKKSGTTLTTFSKSKFPDLKRKPVWLEKIDTLSTTGVFMKCADGSIEQVAFGEAGYDGQGRETDIVQTNEQERYEPSKFSLPGFVKLGIKIATTQVARLGKQAFAKVVIAQGCSEPVFPLPQLVDEDGVLDPVTDCRNEEKTIRQRRACFLRIEDFEGEPVHYVVVIEAQKLAMAPMVAVVTRVGLGEMLRVLFNQV